MRTKYQAPCKDCPERKVTEDYNCHSHCEKYLEFRKLQDEENAKNLHTVDVDEYRIKSPQIGWMRSRTGRF